MSTPSPTPFDLLGLEPGFALDPDLLEQNLFQESLKWHPDRFALADPAQRIAAEDQMAAINEAHDLLVDPLRRAEFLLTTLGGNPNQDKQRNSDPEFLMEMMELREAVEDALADGSDPNTALKLHSELSKKEAGALTEFGNGWKDLNDSPAAKELSALQRNYEHARYLRSTRLQLQQALQPRL